MEFMRGRYGFDVFSKFLMYSSAGFMLSALITQITLFSTVGFTLMIYAYMRALSRNHLGRYKELQFYRKVKGKVQRKSKKMGNVFNTLKIKWMQRKIYKYYSCPECKQKIRVPKGKNKVKITCPNCQAQFIKKT